MKYDWKDESTHALHFYRVTDGKILGTAWQYVNNNIIWCAKILEDEFPFTNSSEKYIGHFINKESAKKSIERFWLVEERTLIENYDRESNTDS